MEDHFDPLERRCPRLGGPVTFAYCKGCGDQNQPCWKIIDCWWEHFDVVTYLRENLPAEAFQKLMDARPKPKLASLVEMIEAAKKRTGS